jgi:hypothetical protein
METSMHRTRSLSGRAVHEDFEAFAKWPRSK